MRQDSEAVFELANRFVTSYVLDKAAFMASFTELVEDEGRSLLVAEEGDDLVGYLLGAEHLTLYANGRVAWIDEIMVDESHRRHGLGKQLMDGFEEWAKARGALVASLATRRASAFYLALGYEESATYFKKSL